MSLPGLEQFLRELHAPFSTFAHPHAVRAVDVAASAGIPCREMAKPVLVRLDGALAMAVVPAHERVDLRRLRLAADAREVGLATEDEFCARFPDSEPGAMPPFGNLYGLALYVDRRLAEDDAICFNAGSHVELIRMRYADFARLASPRVADLVRGP